MREVHALMEGHNFESIDEANARLAELTDGGRLSEMANAWKQDDPKWRAQELAYDALETDDLVTALKLIDEALKLDPDCTDAQRLMVSLVPASPQNKLLLMREVVKRAEQTLGETAFQENAGHFWGVISTRPYMRAKQHLAELLVETGQIEEAIAALEHMLELNTKDNQGMRYVLLGLYLAGGKEAQADRLLSLTDEEEAMGRFAWGRVMQRWLSGDVDEAERALAHAREINPFAERYLAGRARLLEEPPDYYQPGAESEAQVCAKDLAPACASHPEFRKWLRSKERSAGIRR